MTIAVSFGLMSILILTDQLIKLWAIRVLDPLHPLQLIEGLLAFSYVENRGAAFGIFHGQRWLLIGVTSIILGGLCWILASGRAKTTAERLTLVLIGSGGLANLLDRVFRGYVVDYIDINQLFRYPVFNFADCCVVIGAVLMVVLVFIEEKNNKKRMKDGD